MPFSRRLILTAPLLPFAAQAQEAWPARGPIRFIVPGPAGGAGDVTGRLVMERVAARIGQQIVIENRPGAGTNIGMTAVARAAPDGYVLGLASIASHAVNRTLYRSLPFDPVADFAPVSLMALVPNLMVIPPGLPVTNVTEFVAYARARPGQINFGSVGAGSSQHLAGAQFAQATGIEMQHIPYNAGGQMNTDLIGNRIQVLFQSVSAVAELARAGRVRPLAVTGTERAPAFTDVPTLREAGVDIVSTGWFGVVAPAQTPAPILERLHRETVAALAEPGLAARLVAGGSLPRASASRADFARFMAEETARWAPVVRATGATVD
ncbi:tripartite tricarboxylate transporter substrate binding protein [Sediminicoccus sp. KRV36]|uniref:Bug family tripartite tricarboxylate transporter substrate binding protein n=1 Tax=Sediminicoccus sp. KRV36 TaxID=3133721 RepID=UPI00200D6859|nr:tripartite tricarboxylate transporter substrate binding protein [Sediminicoccus rosea]UPY38038.1 tripartite tricarboxylate transporter substrate binding protein [Sediminicoccus rosea]